jgi:hypothetical protein
MEGHVTDEAGVDLSAIRQITVCNWSKCLRVQDLAPMFPERSSETSIPLLSV